MRRLLILTLICANIMHGAASSSSSAASTSHDAQLTEINARIEMLNSILANWPTTFEEKSACLKQFEPRSSIWFAIKNNQNKTVQNEIDDLTTQRDALLAEHEVQAQLKDATRTFNQSVQIYMNNPGSDDETQENALCQTLLHLFEIVHQLMPERCAQLAKTAWFIDFTNTLINLNKRAMLQKLRVITSANNDLHQAVDAFLIRPLDEPASSVSSTPAQEDPEMAAALAASLAMQEQPVEQLSEEEQLRIALERSTIETGFDSPSSEEDEEQQLAAALAISQQETQRRSLASQVHLLSESEDDDPEDDEEDDSDVDPDEPFVQFGHVPNDDELPEEEQMRIALQRSTVDTRFVSSPSSEEDEQQQLATTLALSQPESDEAFAEVRPATDEDQAELARLNPELHAAYLALQTDDFEVFGEETDLSDEATAETDEEDDEDPTLLQTPQPEQPTLNVRNLAIGGGIFATVAAIAIFFLKK